MKVRVLWANLFPETFLSMLKGVKIIRWYWTDSIISKPDRGQLDAIVELEGGENGS